MKPAEMSEGIGAAPALAGDPLSAAARATLLVLVLLAVVAAGLRLLGVGSPGGLLTAHQIEQDLLLVPLFAAAAVVLRARRRTGTIRPLGRRREAALVAGVALLLFLLCVAGTHLLFGDYLLSRDEQMADFDASIYRAGRLAWPVPLAWRPFAGALDQLFVLPIAGHAAWVSNYLPIHAAMRAVAGPLTGPLLVAVGLVALWRVTLRLWPDGAGARAVALLLYAVSGQVLFTGMTAFAMSAHLALNLVWLALFLRDDRPGRIGAIGVGFLATGLHQPLFHPLFALPFLLLLAGRRRWRTLGLYAAAYAAIGLFWLAWPHLVAGGAAAPAASGEGGLSFLDRLLALRHPAALSTLWLMAANLLRFAVWQHLLLLPLAGVGAVACRRDPVARALLLGVALPVAAAALLMPWQGHGWGYRYLHGTIGSLCLLGGYGWRVLERRRAAPLGAMALATAAAVALVLPLQAWIVAREIGPPRALDRRISAMPADMVILDDAAAPYARDLAINRPDLSNRPIRLIADELRVGDVARLCALGRVAFLDAPAFAPLSRLYAVPAPDAPTPRQRLLHAAARRAGCR